MTKLKLKTKERINYLTNYLNNRSNRKNKITMKKYFYELKELEYERNKENIYFRLNSKDKYFYANQFYMFSKHIKENGYSLYNENQNKDLKDSEIYFHKTTISASQSHLERTIKSFSNTDQLIGFIIGYNIANNVI